MGMVGYFFLLDLHLKSLLLGCQGLRACSRKCNLIFHRHRMS